MHDDVQQHHSLDGSYLTLVNGFHVIASHWDEKRKEWIVLVDRNDRFTHIHDRYVTWIVNERGEAFSGHYMSSIGHAVADLYERSGKSLQPILDDRYHKLGLIR